MKRDLFYHQHTKKEKNARTKALNMSYDEKRAFVVLNGWSNKNRHWDNWFHPVSGWNYSLYGAVVDILLYPTKKTLQISKTV